jgi:hypothetical protein
VVKNNHVKDVPLRGEWFKFGANGSNRETCSQLAAATEHWPFKFRANGSKRETSGTIK